MGETKIPQVFTDYYGEEVIRPENVLPRWRPGAYALVENVREEFLFIVMPGDETRLHLPGGEVDMGELVLDAVVREALEETGYSITLKRDLPFFVKQNDYYSKWTQQFHCGLSLFYFAVLKHERQDKSAINQGPFKETERVVWRPRDKIHKEELYPFFQDPFEAALKGGF